ncbi:MAG: T9SS type A sorting domain-containing protein [Calditrichaeota bacterium]|nr:T9SS type A sorting domain-containing protein [Calditrichota bacterium]
MKTHAIRLAVAAAFVLTTRLAADVPTVYFTYLTNYESTVYQEIIWFWTADTLWGRYHSNDYIGLKYSPFIPGRVSTSQDRFIYYQPGNIDYGRLITNAPQVPIPNVATDLRARSNPFITDGNGRMMTWIKMRGGRGIDIYQYPMGSAPRESLVMHLGYIYWGAIFVNGQVEVEGTVFGKFTIGSSGDMWLLDDVKYHGANIRTGYFGDDTPDEGGMSHMLGLVSEGNIIIKNTWRNGRNNGYGVDPNNYERHSIAINGALCALGQVITYPNRSGFTFENQNDDWEYFQGPSPDERGHIFMKGSLTQWRRGYVHRANHGGTGYIRSPIRYDHRFDRIAPPGFDLTPYADLEGYRAYVYLDGGAHTVRQFEAGTLILEGGTTLLLDGIDALAVRDRFEARGTAERPVIIRTIGNIGTSEVELGRGRGAVVLANHLEAADGISFRVVADTIRLDNASLRGEVWLEGGLTLDSSSFKSRVDVRTWSSLLVSRSLFREGLVISGRGRGEVVNNTFASHRFDGIRIDDCRRLEIVNNIVAFGGYGLRRVRGDSIRVSYNLVYDNVFRNYDGVEPGEGALSRDPLFVDRRRDDFNLLAGSPAIDSGDPSRPRDPDGSRADMGAYAFGRRLSVDDNENVDGTSGSYHLTAWPNPFNSRVTIRLSGVLTEEGTLTIYDVAGREVLREVIHGLEVVLDGSRLGGPGIYLVILKSGSRSHGIKVAYVK